MHDKFLAELILNKLGLHEILKDELAWLDGGLEETKQPKASGSSDRLEFMSQFQSNTNMLKLSSILKNIKKKRDKTACEVVEHQKQPPVRGPRPKQPQRKNKDVSSSSSSSSDEDEPLFMEEVPNFEEQADNVVAPNNPLDRFAFVKQTKKCLPPTSKKSFNFFDQSQAMAPTTSTAEKGRCILQSWFSTCYANAFKAILLNQVSLCLYVQRIVVKTAWREIAKLMLV